MKIYTMFENVNDKQFFGHPPHSSILHLKNLSRCAHPVRIETCHARATSKKGQHHQIV